MLVSKNPDVTEPRQNLTSKNPHFALKTGEKSTRNLRLNSVIFIVKKIWKEVVIWLSKTKNTNKNAFVSAGYGFFG